MSSLGDLPDEVILHILSYLQTSDLLQCSRTCHSIRTLTLDPILHRDRRRWAASNLKVQLSRRKSKAEISPPQAWIWLNRTHMLSRSISKSLIKIRLCHSLEHRPAVKELIARAILPQAATNCSPMLAQKQQQVYKSRLKDNLSKRLDPKRRPSMSNLVSTGVLPEECSKLSVSPALIATRRQVIKESLKDGLRAWVETRGIKAQQRRALELAETERKTVKVLVRQITARRLAQELDQRADAVAMERKRAQARWGSHRAREERRAIAYHPTRAHVLGLRRFWESVTKPST